MSNDLIELTNTELDAVSGGKHSLVALNFGNIQVNNAEQSAAVVSMGNWGASTGTITQSIGSQSNSSSGGPSFGNFGNFSF